MGNMQGNRNDNGHAYHILIEYVLCMHKGNTVLKPEPLSKLHLLILQTSFLSDSNYTSLDI